VAAAGTPVSLATCLLPRLKCGQAEYPARCARRRRWRWMVGMTTNERVGLARHDPWRKTAIIAIASLLPTAVLGVLIMASSPAFARCLTYGEECNPEAGVLHLMAWWSLAVSAVAGLTAAVLPASWSRQRQFRPACVLVQLLSQFTMFFAVLLSA
jgi:hypothetical protein